MAVYYRDILICGLCASCRQQRTKVSVFWCQIWCRFGISTRNCATLCCLGARDYLLLLSIHLRVFVISKGKINYICWQCLKIGSFLLFLNLTLVLNLTRLNLTLFLNLTRLNLTLFLNLTRLNLTLFLNLTQLNLTLFLNLTLRYGTVRLG